MQPLVIYPRHGSGEPSAWEDVADEVLAAVQPKAEALARDAAEKFYGSLLSDIQDCLADNAAFNLASRIATADRQALSDRLENSRTKALNGLLFDTLRELNDAVLSGLCNSGTPAADAPDRLHNAMDAATAAIAKAEGSHLVGTALLVGGGS